MDKNIGAMLDGRYEIQKRIGAGGMADVYMAYDIEENREVAVKILKNEFINNDEFLKRFKNESKAVSMLSHPNIVKILDVGFNDEIRFIVMEYIDGITLKDYIDEEGCLDWKETAHLVIQILRALQHAHDRGIIHRDIKPQNIMMFKDGTIKVMDFGIAKFTYELGITATAQTIGSVHYISPEQACGKPTDGKSDIYSVGILMYEMLTGRKPFDTDNPVTVALMQMQDQAELPRNINPDIPEGMEEIVLKAIEKNPQDRYQSANDMIRDIERFKASPKMTFGYYDTAPMAAVKHEEKVYEDPEPEYENDDDYVEEDNYYIGNSRDSRRYDDEDNDETDYDGKKPVMSKVAAVFTVVVIIAVVFGITAFISKTLRKGGADEITMPYLVDYDFDEMTEKYKNKIHLVKDGDPVFSELEQNKIVTQSIDAGSKIKKGDTVYVTVSNGTNVSIVPQVEGLESEDAVKLINKAGFKVAQTLTFNDEIPNNLVIRVSPEAGTELNVSQQVTIFVSKGAQNEAKLVPNVLGKTRQEAEKMIKDAGFEVIVEEKDSDRPKDEVLSQNLQANTLVNPSEKMVIYVSSGKLPEFTVPINITFPANAKGTFKFNAYIENELKAEKSGIDVANSAFLKIELTGSETKTVRIEIENTQTGQRADIGTYTFLFNDVRYETIHDNTQAAFEAVGAIKHETEPVTTQPPQTQVTDPPIHSTAAPDTTQAPVETEHTTEHTDDTQGDVTDAQQ
ncbi:MAG: Stk1 family PASTA domain-containing Ser/Thr kinase [Oscillospiraceae bacterium]|nr:Stk1 family PASTA domain-containing Ser/Thr kinase [Oscillospiraceae bacterium]